VTTIVSDRPSGPVFGGPGTVAGHSRIAPETGDADDKLQLVKKNSITLELLVRCGMFVVLHAQTEQTEGHLDRRMNR
jgi:hypothetical protein